MYLINIKLLNWFIKHRFNLLTELMDLSISLVEINKLVWHGEEKQELIYPWKIMSKIENKLVVVYMGFQSITPCKIGKEKRRWFYWYLHITPPKQYLVCNVKTKWTKWISKGCQTIS